MVDDGQSDAIRVLRLTKPLAGPDLFASLVKASHSDLKSPDRSTVPLLGAWRDFHRSLDELSHSLNHALGRPATLSFEYAVAVVEGKGKSSFTDLMIATPVEAVALEAKYREPEYATVAKWLTGRKADASNADLGGRELSNRELVLRGWLSKIGECTGAKLTQKQVEKCTYQLIHRTASVCSLSDKKWRAVVYQHFYEATESHKRSPYDTQLRRLKELLGDQDAVQFVLLECPFTPTDRFTELVERKRKGERDLANEVSEALLDGELFGFGPWTATIL